MVLGTKPGVRRQHLARDIIPEQASGGGLVFCFRRRVFAGGAAFLGDMLGCLSAARYAAGAAAFLGDMLLVRGALCRQRSCVPGGYVGLLVRGALFLGYEKETFCGGRGSCV